SCGERRLSRKSSNGSSSCVACYPVGTGLAKLRSTAPSRPGSFFFSSRRRHTRSVSAFLLNRSSDLKQELLLLVYELNRSGLLAENEKIRPILAQLEKLLLCDLSPSTNDSVKN